MTHARIASLLCCTLSMQTLIAQPNTEAQTLMAKASKGCSRQLLVKIVNSLYVLKVLLGSDSSTCPSGL
eukprot:9899316-Alexandrium_andersonii.AAC.1